MMAKANTASGKPGKKQTGIAAKKSKVQKAPKPGSLRTIPPAVKARMQQITASETILKKATVTITPVKDIHIVETEVNAVTITTDMDVQKDQAFTASQPVLPSRPLSFFINITGLANTMVSIELVLDTASEFKGDIYIPNSGRLVVQKIIA